MDNTRPSQPLVQTDLEKQAKRSESTEGIEKIVLHSPKLELKKQSQTTIRTRETPDIQENNKNDDNVKNKEKYVDRFDYEKLRVQHQNVRNATTFIDLAIGSHLRRASSFSQDNKTKGNLTENKSKNSENWYKSNSRIGFVSKIHKKLRFNPTEQLVISLYEMGFNEDIIQLIAYGTDSIHIEEAMSYICKGENDKWEHKFVTEKDIYHKLNYEKLCKVCQEKNLQTEHLVTSQVYQSPKKSYNPRIMPLDMNSIQFLKNGVAMKNQRFVQITRRRLGKSFPQNAENSQILDTSVYSGFKEPLGSTEIKNSDICFICGDPLDAHSPDYNFDLFMQKNPEPLEETRSTNIFTGNNKIYRTTRKNVWNNQLKVMNSTSPRLNKPRTMANSIEHRQKCIICLESNFPPTVLKSLPCNHKICTACLGNYIVYLLNNKRCDFIKCPVIGCEQVFDTDLILKFIPLHICDWKMLQARKSDILLMKAKQCINCPKCGAMNLSDNSLAELCPVVCHNCSKAFCRACGSDWHRGYKCSEYLTLRYEEIIRGWEWQTCPSCKEPVKIASECKHMTCPKCLTMFCIFCRKKRQTQPENANNSYCTSEGFRCGLRAKKNYIGLNKTEQAKCICAALAIFLICVILSPLLALFVVPYIVMANLWEYYNREKPLMQKEDKSGFSPNASGIFQNSPSPNNNNINFLKSSSRNQQSTPTLSVTTNAPTFTEKSLQQMSIMRMALRKKQRSCIVMRVGLAGIAAVILTPISTLGIIILGFQRVVSYIFS